MPSTFAVVEYDADHAVVCTCLDEPAAAAVLAVTVQVHRAGTRLLWQRDHLQTSGCPEHPGHRHAVYVT